MSVVEFAAMALKPSVSVTSQDFQSTWKNCLDRTSKAAGSAFQLWQDISIPTYLYFIGTWPDPDAHAVFLKNESADLLKDLAPLITLRFVRHVSVGEKEVPTEAPILSVESFSVEPNMTEVFTEKARLAEETVSKRTAPYTVAGGFDIREDNKKKFSEQYELVKKALGSEDPKPSSEEEKKADKAPAGTENLRWVSFSGWKDEDQHLVSAKEIADPFGETRQKVSMVPNIFETYHMKLLLS